jgi:hypothetical protein
MDAGSGQCNSKGWAIMVFSFVYVQLHLVLGICSGTEVLFIIILFNADITNTSRIRSTVRQS